MSFAELKDRVAELTSEQMLDLSAFIAHLSRTDEPQYQAELDRRLRVIESGKKFDHTDLARLHNDLTVRGR